MKRFGLRALAGTLATLMVVSAFAPAKAANAADDILLIAPNPNALKTLYITEDMVDEDGEIVISGGSYDRVVVSKEVAAKDIYFDQVTVGEMVVESGGESRIQLWEVDAEQVTVQEPELEALSLLDIKDLLKDEETRDVALQMYKESKEKDAKTKKAAPKIVTKEDAQVETLVARANVTLDLADGEVNEVALEGSEKVDRAKVTLKNYTGDVSFKGTEGKSNMTLNNVDSRIKTLKVEESNANNYFAVNARNSVVLKAEVAGNARFALNALTGALEVTEEATAANITLLNTIEEMNIAGDNAVIDVAPCGRVETAAITGDKANVSGSGTLVAVEITGEGAYVSTFGTDVEGENTYVPPVYVEPVYDSWSEDFSDAELEPGVPTDGASMNWAKYSYDAENGYGIASTTAGWQGFAVELDNRDNGSYASFVISLKAKKLGGITNAVRVTENGSWPNLADVVAIGDEWVTIKTGKIGVAAGATRVILIAPEVGQEGITMELAVDDVKVERYTEWTEPPARPKPTENVTYDFSQMTLGTKYGCTTNVVNGALDITYDAIHQEAQYNLPKGMFTDDYDRIVVHMSECTGTIDFKIISGGKNIKDNYGKDGTCILDLSDVPGYEVTTIGIMQDNEGSCSAVIEGFTFVVAGTDYELQTEGPKAPSNLQENALVYGVKDLESKSLIGGYGYSTAAAEHGGLKVVLDDTGYQEIQFNLPEAVSVAEYSKMIVTVSSTTNAFAVKAGGKAWYGKSATKTTDIEFDLSEVTADVTQVGLMAGETTGSEFIVYRIAFLPKEEQKITEFYIAKDVAFTDELVANDGNGNVNANLKDVYLDGDNFKNKLPEALKAVETVANKFTTLAGIIEMVDYFEVEVTLTEATAATEDIAGYAPQAQVYLQSSDWSSGTWGKVIGNIGQPSEGSPKTGTFQHSTALIESWTSPTLAKVGIQIINALENSTVSGTYSVKVVLK